MPRAPVALIAGWALLALGWAMANPPFAAPDEGAHYVRALAVSGGSLIGDEVGRGGVRPFTQSTEQQERFLNDVGRLVEIPGRLSPPDPICYVLDSRRPATCVDAPSARPEDRIEAVTYVGSYPPAPYFFPAALVRAGDRGTAAVRWGRIGGLIPAIGALALAAALLWDPRVGAASLLGLVAAVTPMALFCAASLTSSGLEIAAGIAFLSALLRVRRDGGAPRGWVWAAVAVSGAALALSRTASLAWLGLSLLLFLGLFGPRRAGALLLRARGAQVAAGALAVAALVHQGWEWLYGPEVILGLANGRQAVRDGLDQLRHVADQLVIGYGYLEFGPPWFLSVGWLAIVVALLAAALAVSGRRDRLALLAVTVAAPLVPLALYVAILRHTGYGVQGRYVLPVLVAVPLLAGELVREGWDRLATGARRALLLGVPVLAGAGQVVAWWWNERRAAVGTDGPLWFLDDAAWTPPAAWGVWLAIAFTGAALATAAVARASS